MTNALPSSVPMCPWARLCRLVLTWRITRSCTCGPRAYRATVTLVTITAYATVTRTRASRASSRSNIFKPLCARRISVVVIAACQLPASFQAVHSEIGRHAVLFGRKDLPAKPFHRHAEKIEVFIGNLLQRRLRKHPIAPPGPLPHPLRHIDINSMHDRPDPIRSDHSVAN